jgi:hypothetical protein
LSDQFRAALADVLDNPPVLVPPIRHYSGIVIVAGGDLYGRLAFHLITCLRGLGCKLAIEVWHFEHEMPDPLREAFAELPSVRLVDATAYCRERGIVPRPVKHPGWWLKAFAVRHCQFAQAMLIDADNVPVVNPEPLLHDKGYEKAGAMFWPDLPPPRQRGEWVPTAAWEKVGLDPVPTARPFESGQLIVNRTRHLHALDVAVMLNEWSDVTYEVVYGDKDCWLLAWHLVGARYHMPPRNPIWKHPAIHQHDTQGRLVFQHACQAKHEIARGDVLKPIVNRRFAPDAAAILGAKMGQYKPPTPA